MSRDDRGAGTVLVLGVCAAGLMLAMLACLLTVALLANRRAEAAADLAALAAASSPGTPVDCSRAAAVSAANGARLQSCTGAQDGSVVVDVEVVAAAGAGWPPLVAHARARAGLPASALPGSGQQRVQQGGGSRLVERLVAVPALGGLDARGAAEVAGQSATTLRVARNHAPAAR